MAATDKPGEDRDRVRRALSAVAREVRVATRSYFGPVRAVVIEVRREIRNAPVADPRNRRGPQD